MPERIQLRRTKGWRRPPDVINVARPTRWGNHFFVTDYWPGTRLPGPPLPDGWHVWSAVSVALDKPMASFLTRDAALDHAVDVFRGAVLSKSSILVPSIEDIREHLAGRDLRRGRA